MSRAILITVFLCLVSALPCQAGTAQELSILYIKQSVEHPPVLSNLIAPPQDAGLAGARLAITDSNTTGRFTRQHFLLKEVNFRPHDAPIKVVEELKKHHYDFVLLDLPAATLEAVLKMDPDDRSLLFNVSVADNRFRTELCRKNLFHTLPSRSMLTDALTQYLVKKRWTDWDLIVGPMAGDRLYAKALLGSAKKFGAHIIDQKVWNGGRDARRTAQAEIPRLTQGIDYDVLLVADELGDFGEYLMYRTWKPRPVAGTQGLFATAWYWTIEQWGATQLQDRFHHFANRRMIDKDYAAWTAVRSIAEAATRTRSVNRDRIAAYIQSPSFELAAYKGRKLSYRPWSGQLRQPIAVTAARSLVTQSPQEGYLHPNSELDTLGFDAPEVHCMRN